MSNALAIVNLTVDTAPSGLVSVNLSSPAPEGLAEQIAVRQAFKLSEKINYIFFRRFNDGRAPQISAYIIDNADEKLSKDELKEIHHRLWLSGITPLLYVGWNDSVDIFSCAAGESTRQGQRNRKEWDYSPAETIKLVSDISTALEKAKQYSAYKLSDGTFWDDPRNFKLVNASKAAHNTLIEKVKMVDQRLAGDKNPTARRLLLLTLLIKYLEDRRVFPSSSDGQSWFSGYRAGARSFLDILESASVESVRSMFTDLENKFNGDIFSFTGDDAQPITPLLLRELASLVSPNVDARGQLYFWDIYSFEYIPVEVLSHIYQHFADKNKGAIFTPPMIVNLLLDQAMPLDTLRGDETIFDPTCGSGVFLVSAFRRLVHIWSAKHSWSRPTPRDLKELLSKTIFGIEYQEEAANVTAFSLALAICDALLPNIIWSELRFDKMLGRNILVGDFNELNSEIVQVATGGKGFSVIVGNPPFLSKLTSSMQIQLDSRNETVPDKQIAYYILKECARACLSVGGKMCIIQPAGLLYNERTFSFRKEFFFEHKVDAVLDFVSIRGLFHGADTKVIAILVARSKPNKDHIVKHWTFRRTVSVKGLIHFELDYYDHNFVPQIDIEQHRWTWKANLLGGGRLHHLAKKLSQLPVLLEKVHEFGWSMGEGFISGKKNKKTPAAWLTGMEFIPADAIGHDGLDRNRVSRVGDELFDYTGPTERYKSPMFLIKENIELHNCFIDDGDMAYKASVVGINAPEGDLKKLSEFSRIFTINRKRLSAACCLLGSRMLVGKATAPLKSEIERLPWFDNGKWLLAPWEEELLGDIYDFMAAYVRLGNDSKLLSDAPSGVDVDNYCETFLRIMKENFPDVQKCGRGRSDGLMYQAFNFFGEGSNKLLEGDWSRDLRATVFKGYGDVESLRSVRIVRIYEENMIIFVKPDVLRFWIRSAAVRDVDDTLFDVFQGES